jgi:polyhydroxyalkanoate synthesis regulator phasin
MKQKISLTEEELIEIIDSLVESQNLSQYNEEDFIDVFLEVFKPWIKEKLGDNWKKSPISKLIDDYYEEFLRDYGIEEQGYGYYNLARKMSKAGRDIVTKGIYSLPSLQPTEKFTTKYQKILSFILKNMDIPPYAEISLTEDEPYYVKMRITTNWLDMITSDESTKRMRPSHIYENIVKTLKDYMGIETSGKPIYGELHMNLNNSEMFGVDEWVKQILNKEIKSELKKSEVGRNIHSLAFKPERSTFMGEFKIRMKGDAAWNDRNKAKDKLKEILKNKGYNLKFFQIET